MRYLSVKNWEQFQHYKDRSPTWVKLYQNLLTSESWVLGNDLSRLVQIAITLLAARYSNKIPLRFDLIKRVTNLDCNESNFNKSVDLLVDLNFLEINEVTNKDKPLMQSASDVLAKCSSEKRREDKEQDMSPAGTVAIGIQKVFDHWREAYQHPKAQLDEKRRKVISLALKSYTADDLCQSISGYRHSPHHMGKNERHTVYDDIEVFLRDAKHIDAGLKMATRGENEWVG